MEQIVAGGLWFVCGFVAFCGIRRWEIVWAEKLNGNSTSRRHEPNMAFAYAHLFFGPIGLLAAAVATNGFRDGFTDPKDPRP